jgi:hypothetical protein
MRHDGNHPGRFTAEFFPLLFEAGCPRSGRGGVRRVSNHPAAFGGTPP